MEEEEEDEEEEEWGGGTVLTKRGMGSKERHTGSVCWDDIGTSAICTSLESASGAVAAGVSVVSAVAGAGERLAVASGSVVSRARVGSS